jgi:hypothetical protein
LSGNPARREPTVPSPFLYNWLTFKWMWKV